MSSATSFPNKEYDLKIGDKVTIEFEVTERQDEAKQLVSIDYINLKSHTGISGVYQVNSLHIKR